LIQAQAATKGFEHEQTEKTEAGTFCQKCAAFRYCTAKVVTGLTECPWPRMAALESCKACSSCQQNELPQENAGRQNRNQKEFNAKTQRRKDAKQKEKTT
jgi:hypothetical protein